jgi:hypothetical protein
VEDSVDNPIQRKIKEGMSPIVAFLSEATCGEPCWEAREDVCRCSCGGKNHGCMRTPDGIRPTRNSKIDGYRYELKAVGDGVWEEAKAINQAAGITFVYASTSRDACFASIPAKLRTPTDAQIENWPELTAYRSGDHWTDEHGKRHYIDKPYLLWVRVA